MVVAVVAAWFPVHTAAALALKVGGSKVRARLRARRSEADAHADVVTLAELCALGLAAGLDFAGALRRASEALSPGVQADVAGVLRRASTVGLATALAGEPGRCRRLFRLAARAVDTGAPVRSAVEAFIDDATADERARSLASMRRLPVKLLFPLAFLILPGFIVLTVGPALLGSVQRFSS